MTTGELAIEQQEKETEFTEKLFEQKAHEAEILKAGVYQSARGRYRGRDEARTDEHTARKNAWRLPGVFILYRKSTCLIVVVVGAHSKRFVKVCLFVSINTHFCSERVHCHYVCFEKVAMKCEVKVT